MRASGTTRRRRSPSPTAGVLRVEDRRATAWSLRLEGLALGEIATMLGVDRRTVSRDLKKAIAARRAEAGEAIRELEAERLDVLQRAVWPKATRGDVPAVQAALAVLQRRAALEGMDKGKGGGEEAGRYVFQVLIGVPDLAPETPRAVVDAAVAEAVDQAIATSGLPAGARITSFVRLYGVDISQV